MLLRNPGRKAEPNTRRADEGPAATGVDGDGTVIWSGWASSCAGGVAGRSVCSLTGWGVVILRRDVYAMREETRYKWLKHDTFEKRENVRCRHTGQNQPFAFLFLLVAAAATGGEGVVPASGGAASVPAAAPSGGEGEADEVPVADASTSLGGAGSSASECTMVPP